jgi:hypothetical protein
MRTALATLGAVLLLAACGQTRRYGDDGGRPVAFSVHLERPFVKSMHYNQWRPSVGAGAAFGSGGRAAYGTGVGFSFSSTRVDLLGGDGPAEAQVFIHELKWGDNAFTVPLTPGRKLHLTAKASGGREGWESLGEITVPRGEDPRVVITLDANGSKMAVTPVEAPTAAPPAQTKDGGPAVERTPAPSPTPQPAAADPSQAPEQHEPAPWVDNEADRAGGVYSPAEKDATPVLEHADAGDKPPGDDNPPLKVEIAPPPGAPPVTAPNATPAAPYDPTKADP